MKIPLILVCFFITLYGAAQYPLTRNYSALEGLSNLNISSMIQDREGFIWISTDVGVSRFDGREIRNFTIADGLCDISITKLKADSKGRIWFMGANGKVCYRQNGIIYNESTDTLLKTVKEKLFFYDLFEDSQNKFWFQAFNNFLILDKGTISRTGQWGKGRSSFVMNGSIGQIILSANEPFAVRYVSGKLFPLKLQYKVSYSLLNGCGRMQDGSVLFIANEGLVSQKDTMQTLVIPNAGDFNELQMRSVVLCSESLVWVNIFGKGLYCFNLRDTKAKPIIYFADKTIRGVLEDHEGNIWVNIANEGLFMMPVSGREVRIFDKSNGLLDNKCNIIAKLPSGMLIMGQNADRLQSLFHNELSEYKLPAYNYPNNEAYRILSKNDDVWIATYVGLIHKNAKTGCNHWVDYKRESDGLIIGTSSVYDLALAKDRIYLINNFFIMEYPLKCNGKSKHLASKIHDAGSWIFAMCYDHSGTLWFGTRKGLCSRKNDQIKEYYLDDELLTKHINSIVETDDSIIVLATQGYGLLFCKEGKIVQRITSAQGLCSDVCNKVRILKNHIYVATPLGVSVLEYKDEKINSIMQINTGNFLPSNIVNDVTVDDSDIALATSQGIVIIPQGELERLKPVIPMISILEVRGSEGILSLDSHYVFSHNKNSFKIKFTGISFGRPDEIEYRYRLNDSEPWQITQNTALEFPYLEPGNYTFQIQGRVKLMEWSPFRSFSFIINPPFWSTYWFRILMLIFFILIFYLIIRRRQKAFNKRQEEKMRVEKQITMLEQQALQTMMNPHFIFNVMNSIQHFINANEKEAANRYLSDFATLIRMNLTISYKRFIPLEEEIRYLKLYLSFEKLRFGDNLTYDIIIDPLIDASETSIAVMMIQPFLENAIWHGILPLKAKGHINVSFHKEEGDLIKLTVEDNGVGIKEEYLFDDFKEKIKESHALSMTFQRLNLLGRSLPGKLYIRYRYAFPDRINKGTIAEMLLPAYF